MVFTIYYLRNGWSIEGTIIEIDIRPAFPMGNRNNIID